MADNIDLSVDHLADVALTPEQRHVWEALRSEVAVLQVVNRELQEKVRQFERERQEDQQGVLDRNDFNREVSRMLAFDERYGGITSILYFDFDGLDEAAEKFGPEARSLAVQKIGAVLVHDLRKSDIVGRLASDEFGVLLMRCENVTAWQKGERLSASLQRALNEIEAFDLKISVSFGAYTFRDNDDVTVGLKEAELAITRSEK